MKVLVIKDADGILRPQSGIWQDTGGVYADAVRSEWENNLSHKSINKGKTLVEADLIEIIK